MWKLYSFLLFNDKVFEFPVILFMIKVPGQNVIGGNYGNVDARQDALIMVEGGMRLAVIMGLQVT